MLKIREKNISRLFSCLLGWISFAVPDWHELRRFNDSDVEFYGLWSYCQEQSPTFAIVCRRWPTAEDQLFNGSRPDFINVSEGLFTTGMVLLSLGLVAALIALVLPLLAYVAAILAFLAFLFLVIGLPIFGRQSNDLSRARGDVSYNKRYGFWLMVPTIVLEFLAILAFLAAGLLYKMFGFGNIASSSKVKPYMGQQMLGPANMLNLPPNTNPPYAMRPFPVLYGGGMRGSPYSSNSSIYQPLPSLLSDYLNERPMQYRNPIIIQAPSPGVLPQPSIVRAASSAPMSSMRPAYVRSTDPIFESSTSIINLSGQTILGPLQRTG